MTGAALPVARTKADMALLVLSLAGCDLLVGWLVLPAIAYRDSVTGLAYDALWRSSAWRQLTGFCLLGCLLLTGLLSLRKCWPAFRFGAFAGWRAFHAAASVVALVLAVTHTGLRLGSNLDAVLMATFLLAASLGALAGFAATLERALSPGRGRWLRAQANRIHLYLVWPLPLLVLFHVLRFYYF
jgi:nitrite reductase (NADH) large subunit